MPASLIGVRYIDAGPFKGRAYEVHPDGSTGRRRPDLEVQPIKVSRREKHAIERFVRGIPNQGVLDTILDREPDAMTRAAILDQWRPWLTFEPSPVS